MERSDQTAQETGIVVCGDSHGNAGFLTKAMHHAAERGIGRVLQLGDFGVWPGNSGRRFLDAVDQVACDTGVQVEFIDGNHEDFDQLDALRRDGQRRSDGAVRVREHVSWWTRGTVSVIGGRRFGFMGGAVSIDAQRRVERHSWWPQEAVEDADIDLLVHNAGGEDLDVLVAHDAFSGIALPSRNWSIPANLLERAEQVRRRLLRAVETTRPQLYLHGHWHMDYRTRRWLGDKEIEVRGVGAEDDAFGVLDLANLHLAGSVPTLQELHTLLA